MIQKYQILKKITDHNHEKYITTPEFNNLAAGVFNARLAQADLVRKTYFDTKPKSLNKKITANKTKHLLVETELKKLEKFDAAYFRGKNYFDGDGTQNYLVFQPVHKYFERVGDEISSWESKGLSNKNISSSTTSNYGQAPRLVYNNARIKLRFNGDLLKQDKVTYNHGPIVNIYIVYRLILSVNTSYRTLENCLFGAVRLTKNDDSDKYKHFGYGIGFDSRGRFTHPSGGYGRNVIIFRADLSSSTHANNIRSISVLGKDFIQRIDDTIIYAEIMYSTNFTVDNKNFCLSFHYIGESSYLFINGKKIINFKAEDYEIVP